MIQEQIQSDIIAAMKAKEEHTVTTLRMAKASLQNREKEKKEPLTEAEAEAVLTTLIKQRKDSIDQFTKGNRPELAEKELKEISLLEKYLPKEASNEVVRGIVGSAIEGIKASGAEITPKSMGLVIKEAKNILAVANLRADGKTLSELVKTALSK